MEHKTLTGLVRQNEKGLYFKEGKHFGLIDRNFANKLTIGDEWEFKIAKVIVDKKGKQIPILVPYKRKFSFDEKTGMFTCGNNQYNLQTIKEWKIVEKWYLKGKYDMKGIVISPDNDEYDFNIDYETFENWQGVPKDLKNKIKKEIERLKNQYEEECIQTWVEMKKDNKIQEKIKEFLNYWKGKQSKKEEQLENDICFCYQKLEDEFTEKFKEIQVIDFRVRHKHIPGCRHYSKVYYFFKLKDGQELIFERDNYWNGMEEVRLDEPNRLSGVGLGDWIDNNIRDAEIEKLIEDYEKGRYLQNEREKLIEELEKKLHWWELWKAQEQKIKIEDNGKDLIVSVLQPWGEWNRYSFLDWFYRTQLSEEEDESPFIPLE